MNIFFLVVHSFFVGTCLQSAVLSYIYGADAWVSLLNIFAMVLNMLCVAHRVSIINEERAKVN